MFQVLRSVRQEDEVEGQPGLWEENLSQKNQCSDWATSEVVMTL